MHIELLAKEPSCSAHLDCAAWLCCVRFGGCSSPSQQVAIAVEQPPGQACQQRHGQDAAEQDGHPAAGADALLDDCNRVLVSREPEVTASQQVDTIKSRAAAAACWLNASARC